MDISYFSGKLEMYFRYRNFNFRRIEPTMSELFVIKKKTGTSQTPLVFDKIKNIWLRDTTYIIEYMEENYVSKSCKSPVFPKCESQRFISFLLEDFADEYMWRPAMYMRWEPKVDSNVVSTRFVWEFVDNSGLVKLIPKFLARWTMSFRQWLFSVYGEGVVDEDQHNIIKSQYYTVLDTLQHTLVQTPFLLGSHPTIVDFGFLGPFFRHFASDPSPRKIMQQQAPAVYEWVGRMWNCKDDKLPSAFESNFTEEKMSILWSGLSPLVAEYLHYLHENALAWKANKSSFNFQFKGGHSVAKHSLVQTVQYRVWCRKELQRRFNELQAKDVSAAQKLTLILTNSNCWDILWKDGMIECPPEFGTEPPFCKPHPNAKLPDTPKWSLEALLMRYIKERLHIILLSLIILSSIIFVFISYFFR